ncbi:hypothetical protein JX265_007322 [Neoarthrinium moseri]|uniref:Uncharacterized protein n=1 Tax=Neoarthrinium moseri TaxID=1658444 RepID=A0A9P9WKC0_9PEZI|nr:hypothetical protein JX265_007322 [Neoarthrinium moseri]
MAGILIGVGAMLVGKALVTPYEKCRDYERTVRQVGNDLENLNIALENIRQHELKDSALDFLHKAERQYERSVKVLNRYYPETLPTTRLLGYSIENGRYKHLLDIGVEANQTTRTLNDILGEERWKKIMSKGEAVKNKLDKGGDALDKLQGALDCLRKDITVLKTARDVDEADVAMQRLLKSSRRALQVQQRTGRPKHEMAKLIENLNDAFEYLLNTNNNREKRRAIKYLGGVIQDVDGELNNLGILHSPKQQREVHYNLAPHVEDVTTNLKEKGGHEFVAQGMKRSSS